MGNKIFDRKKTLPVTGEGPLRLAEDLLCAGGTTYLTIQRPSLRERARTNW